MNNRLIKKSIILAKETTKLAISTVAGLGCANTILNAVKRPDKTDKYVAGLVGGITTVTVYHTLDMVDDIITESAERVKRA